MIIRTRAELSTWRPASARREPGDPRDSVELSEGEAPPATVPCPLCAGAKACDPCYGSGFLWSGFLCPWCGGSGKCHRCGGAGSVAAPGFILVLVYRPAKYEQDVNGASLTKSRF